MTKECKFCNQILPYSMFGKKNHKDGRENTCKVCRRKRKPKRINKCKQCNVEYIAEDKDSVFCEAKCAGLHRRVRTKVSCYQCGNSKYVINSKLKRISASFCNQECRSQYLRKSMMNSNNPNYKKIDYECDGCNKIIKVEPSRIYNQNHVFCNNDCYKENIGKFYTGANNKFYNHELTDEERQETRRYKDYYNWRKAVYERDKFTCKNCGDNKGGNLVAHHILNYSTYKELRVDINNGITLCSPCHIDFHKTYGYRNNNKKQLNEFMERTLAP